MRLVDADALKKKFAYITYIRFTSDMGQGRFEIFSEKEVEEIIDKAPTVSTEDCKGCPYCPNSNSGIPIGVE